MEFSAKKLEEILVEPGFVSKADFKAVRKEAEEKQISLEEVFLEKGLILDEQLGQLLAQALGFGFINLRREKIEPEVLSLVPEIVARSQKVIAFARDAEGLKVAMRRPQDLAVRHFLAKRAGQKVVPFYVTENDFQAALYYYEPSLKDEFAKVIQAFKKASLKQNERNELIVKMVDVLLHYGYQNKASDIHLEPRRNKALIRFRIDGVMHEVLETNKEIYELMLMRIKILAKMRTDEQRAAQDGKFRFKAPQEMVDVRISVVPVTEGENVVMRLLSAKSRQFNLSNLGLDKTNLKKVEAAIKRPHGMILVTGPTGSGKTTTLYALIKLLHNPKIHIATIEDPVEYDIEGISQIQVNPKTNLTFAKGLRAIVRQDPDIIMVGEIRDEETADIAVNSALTGHLVLSTLHTNDAATTLPRLLDMGIEPFLVASTVNIAIAQRLVRKICQKCRISYEPTNEEKEIIKGDKQLKEIFESKGQKDLKKLRLYKGGGCKVCANTGFSGRAGIFEVLEMGQKIKELVVKRASSDKILQAAKKEGMITMLTDGVDKVLSGLTTLEEVLRVTRE